MERNFVAVFWFILLVIKAKQDQSNCGVTSIHICVTDFMAKLKLKTDLFSKLKCIVGGRYFVVGGKITGCRHILTGLKIYYY